ncbi:hypothetical protein DD237_001901 [Peronospora effusa]|uniref:Uncharacterized protein n=1 Tax=Peronospora effusa TaxID=542832 RepID=A0A3R7Y019_9STRA|nr:hypothetical protein DD237_001901 [Peronospora effusa]
MKSTILKDCLGLSIGLRDLELNMNYRRKKDWIVLNLNNGKVFHVSKDVKDKDNGVLEGPASVRRRQQLVMELLLCGKLRERLYPLMKMFRWWIKKKMSMQFLIMIQIDWMM